MKHRDDTEQITPVVADEPVMVHQPRRRLNRILLVYAVLSLICGGAGGYIGYSLSNWRTDQRVDALEADLAARRANRAAEDDARDARLNQTRRDLCIVLDRLQPRDAPLEEMRRRYGCTGPASPGPSVSPTPGPTPAPPGATGSGPGGGWPAPAGAAQGSAGTRGATGPGGSGGQPAPSPRPPSTTRPPTSPPPAPTPPPLLDVCVPLLELCVSADGAVLLLAPLTRGGDHR